MRKRRENVYLDNGATSFPKAPGVGEAMCQYIERVGRNVGRGSYAPAMDAAGQVLSVREKLQKLVNAPSSRNVLFTPGATWGLNLLLHGLLRRGTRCSPPLWSTTPSCAPWSS